MIAVAVLFLIIGMAIPVSVMGFAGLWLKHHPDVLVKFVTHKMIAAAKQGTRDAIHH
jgi:hypothetical protein